MLAIMPWNYPLWEVVRFAAPALKAGNSGLLKHASNVPQSALYLDTLVERGGFPAGAFSVLLIGSKKAAAVLQDKRVKAVTLTGSEPAAREVAANAGGHAPDRAGWFYEPTLITDLHEGMRLVLEEAFGPVASLYRVSSRE